MSVRPSAEPRLQRRGKQTCRRTVLRSRRHVTKQQHPRPRLQTPWTKSHHPRRCKTASSDGCECGNQLELFDGNLWCKHL